MVKVEAGKFYKTIGGDIRGPMEYRPDCRDFVDPKMDRWWRADGWTGGFARGHTDDLIEEYTPNPIRTITRKEIVPGIYGQIKIGEIVNVPDCERPHAPVALYAYVDFREACLNADELDAAASVLTQIAAVLRENQ